MAKTHKQRSKLASTGVQLDLFNAIPQIDEVEETKEAEKNVQIFGSILNTSLLPETLNVQEAKDTEEAIAVDGVDGLTYVHNFISKAEHDLLLEKIDDEPWLTELKRRVQHYGYKYDYAKHQINRSMYIAPLPNWSLGLAQRLHKSYSPTLPDQLIVNEYEPGQGIANHTDCRTCFRDSIISLSLGSPCVMDFINPNKELKKSLLLEPRSLIVLKGEARYEWTHGIAKRKSDNFQGQNFKRTRRVSLTLRTVILPN